MWLERETAYLATALALIFIAAICVTKRHSFLRTIGLLTLVTYSGIVVSLVFFPLLVVITPGMGIPDLGWNAVPFKSIVESLSLFSAGHGDLFFLEVFGNVALLVPLGFLAPLLFEKLDSFKSVCLLGVSVGFGIELVQLFCGMIAGSFYRNVNVDDALLNILGCVLGYLLARLCKSIQVNICKQKK